MAEDVAASGLEPNTIHVRGTNYILSNTIQRYKSISNSNGTLDRTPAHIPQDAEDMLEKASKARIEHLGEQYPTSMHGDLVQSKPLAVEKPCTIAINFHTQFQTLLRKIYGDNHKLIIRPINSLCKAYQALSRNLEAEKHLRSHPQGTKSELLANPNPAILDTLLSYSNNSRKTERSHRSQITTPSLSTHWNEKTHRYTPPTAFAQSERRK